ncbi:endospore germination permease [Paenibacillus sp. NEAU-GSW1]|uniref:GerAB/ArcD/ProY family transporter n=1 Tax=Paenibacillus sp. NEAU-GSW1 TaxID=2682486 RepID=UPI001566BE66|nr:endospore germination permease [Paenibacillus sp. NEAU-GSW1]
MKAGNGLTNGMITSGQAAKLLFLFALGTAALIVMTTVVAIAKQDAWITTLVVAPINYWFLLIYLKLAERFPDMTLAQYTEKILGKWLGKALLLLYVFFFVILSALVLRNISDFLVLSILPTTPDWFIAVSFMLVVIYGTYLGIETIARTGELLFGGSILLMFIISALLLNQFHIENFKPVLYHGWEQPLKGMYPLIGFPIGEFVVMSMVLPFVRTEDRGKLRKQMKLSIMLIVFFSFMLSVLLIGVLGVEETMRSPFSIFDMAKTINVQDVIVRVEVTVAIVWVSTVFSKLILSFYASALLSAQVLGLKSYRPLIFPIAYFVVPISLISYRNSAHAEHFAKIVWTPYSVVMGFIIPLLLLLLAFLTGRKGPKNSAQPVPTAVETSNAELAGNAQQSGSGQAGESTPS